MKEYALVFALGAVTGVLSSCGSGLSADDIRSAGKVNPAGTSSPVDPLTLETGRISTCLALGKKAFGDLHATSRIATLDLDGMSCGDCLVEIDLPLPQIYLDHVRVGYIFGHLTLQEPSDSVLEKLPDICAKSWLEAASHEPVCRWERTAATSWQSGTFSVRVSDGEPSIASVDLQKPVAREEKRVASEKLPFFSHATTLTVESIGGSVVSWIFSLEGYVEFVPVAVEVVRVPEGKLLGCLPVTS